MSKIVVPMLDRALDVVERAGVADSGWASARYIATHHELLLRTARGVQQRADTYRGTAVRVLSSGGTGMATTTDPSAAALEDAATGAIESARASAALPDASQTLPTASTKGTFGLPADAEPSSDDDDATAAPVQPTPAASLASFVEPTERWLTAMFETENVCDATVELHATARSVWLATTTGARVEHHVRSVAASMRATACSPDDPDDKVTRRLQVAGGGGAEVIDSHDWQETAQRLAGEAALLVGAPRALPSRKSLVLAPDVMAVLVYETLARPLLGPAPSDSWLAEPGATVGNERLTLTADPERLDGLGSYGFDDDGRLAQAVTLISRGVLQARLEPSAIAVNRAFDPGRNPLPQLTNVDMAAGGATREELIAEAGDSGLWLTDPVQWWLSPGGETIAVACAMARYCSSDGTLGGFIRGPVFEAPVAELWASMAAVGDTLENRPSPICGHGPAGEPLRVSHRVAPALFTDISVGPGR